MKNRWMYHNVGKTRILVCIAHVWVPGRIMRRLYLALSLFPMRLNIKSSQAKLKLSYVTDFLLCLHQRLLDKPHQIISLERKVLKWDLPLPFAYYLYFGTSQPQLILKIRSVTIRYIVPRKYTPSVQKMTRVSWIGESWELSLIFETPYYCFSQVLWWYTFRMTIEGMGG
jgi:hypothetical protein